MCRASSYESPALRMECHFDGLASTWGKATAGGSRSSPLIPHPARPNMPQRPGADWYLSLKHGSRQNGTRFDGRRDKRAGRQPRPSECTSPSRDPASRRRARGSFARASPAGSGLLVPRQAPPASLGCAQATAASPCLLRFRD